MLDAVTFASHIQIVEVLMMPCTCVVSRVAQAALGPDLTCKGTCDADRPVMRTIAEQTGISSAQHDDQRLNLLPPEPRVVGHELNVAHRGDNHVLPG